VQHAPFTWLGVLGWGLMVLGWGCNWQSTTEQKITIVAAAPAAFHQNNEQEKHL
jgi:hypothetical protein